MPRNHAGIIRNIAAAHSNHRANIGDVTSPTPPVECLSIRPRSGWAFPVQLWFLNRIAAGQQKHAQAWSYRGKMVIAGRRFALQKLLVANAIDKKRNFFTPFSVWPSFLRIISCAKHGNPGERVEGRCKPGKQHATRQSILTPGWRLRVSAYGLSSCLRSCRRRDPTLSPKPASRLDAPKAIDENQPVSAKQFIGNRRELLCIFSAVRTPPAVLKLQF